MSTAGFAPWKKQIFNSPFLECQWEQSIKDVYTAKLQDMAGTLLLVPVSSA